MHVQQYYRQRYLTDGAQPRLPATGPLKAHPKNPRYFADAGGQAVYLVGSHTWANFVEIGYEGDKPFDYDAYLDFMVEHQFNFMRFWQWEHSAWATWTPEKPIFGPLPYRRIRPELALDGKPKFDLDQFDQAYFDRMRGRLMMAGDRGIYASIMLFQGFSSNKTWSSHLHNTFRGHYYNVHNNVQAFDGDRMATRRWTSMTPMFAAARRPICINLIRSTTWTTCFTK